MVLLELAARREFQGDRVKRPKLLADSGDRLASPLSLNALASIASRAMTSCVRGRLPSVVEDISAAIESGILGSGVPDDLVLQSSQ